MERKAEVQQLIDDLVFVKKAITKNSNILKLVNLGQVLSRVIFAAGILTIVLAGTAYMLTQKYGSLGQFPAPLRYAIIAFSVLLVAGTGISKVYSLIKYVNRNSRDMTVRRLIGEIYTPRALHVLVPYLTCAVLLVIFLIANQHHVFLVPALAILAGLLCLAYVNVFYMKELIITGDWLLATGLLSLFFTGSLHPLLAVILTFGLGFCTIYPANRYLGGSK